MKEASVPIKTEASKKEVVERTEMAASVPSASTSKKDTKADENDRKSESVPPTPQASTVTTKSRRASKPSTPALATFQEAAQSRPRASRNTEGNGTNKKSQKKGNPTIHAIASQAPDEDTNSSMQGDEEEEAEVDADELTYCYCNSVSYGEMVACDADECPREWFHLECVGLRVAPGSKGTFSPRLVDLVL